MIAIGAAKNVFEAIRRYGHDDDYTPSSDGFMPTDAPPGSPQKVEVLIRRVELGQPLWHSNDRADFAGVLAGGSQSGMDVIEGVGLRQMAQSFNLQEVEQGVERPQGLERPEETSPIQTQPVTRRDYSPRIRSKASAHRRSSAEIKSQISPVEPPGMPDEESAALTVNSSKPLEEGLAGIRALEESGHLQTGDSFRVASHASELGHRVLRPPNARELSLIQDYQDSVDTGQITLDVFNRFLRELASEGVDLSAAA